MAALSDNNSGEESEEHVAALSLLSFARVQPDHGSSGSGGGGGGMAGLDLSLLDGSLGALANLPTLDASMLARLGLVPLGDPAGMAGHGLALLDGPPGSRMASLPPLDAEVSCLHGGGTLLTLVVWPCRLLSCGHSLTL
jgi:hypothetical protein